MQRARQKEFTASLGEYSPYSPADIDAAAEALDASPPGAAVVFYNNRLIRNQAREARVFASFDDAMMEMTKRTISGPQILHLPKPRVDIWCAPVFVP